MNELKELFYVLQRVMEKNEDNTPPIPLFSFEGLPGAGKTTQIELVSEALQNIYGFVHFIDLPTSSAIGKILKSLYNDKAKWEEIRKSSPWLNPLLISADLRQALCHAKRSGAQCALMSRGIVSTYYYNLDAYTGLTFDERWANMSPHMTAFYKPTAIVFLDIDEYEAHKRVKIRNRGPLRNMDQIEQMQKDKFFLQHCLEKISDVPVHYINAKQDISKVTDEIIQVITKYLEKI